MRSILPGNSSYDAREGTEDSTGRRSFEGTLEQRYNDMAADRDHWMRLAAARNRQLEQRSEQFDKLWERSNRFEAKAERLRRALVAAGVTEKLVDSIAEGE